MRYSHYIETRNAKQTMNTIQSNAEEIAEDGAIERFNVDMSNSCDDGDRKQATAWLAERIGDAAKAERLRRDWMIQQRQAAREARQ